MAKKPLTTEERERLLDQKEHLSTQQIVCDAIIKDTVDLGKLARALQAGDHIVIKLFPLSNNSTVMVRDSSGVESRFGLSGPFKSDLFVAVRDVLAETLTAHVTANQLRIDELLCEITGHEMPEDDDDERRPRKVRIKNGADRTTDQGSAGQD